MGLDSSSRLLATLYAAPMQPELWNVFMAEMARLAGVSKAALIAHDLGDQRHSIAASFGDKVNESRQSYESWYYKFDEWTLQFPRFSRRLGARRIFRGEEIWPEELLRRSVFYHEFLKKFDTCEMAVLGAGGSGERFDALSIYRGPNEPAFDQEQFAILQMLSPHLPSAFEIRRRLLTLQSRASDLENALDQLETAMALVNAEGAAVFVNCAARRIFDKRDGLHLCRSRILAESPTENGRIREITARAISGGRSRSFECGGAALVSRTSGRALQVLAAPFVSPGRLPEMGAVAVLFISDPDLKPALRTETLREMYGLTRAEARLALHLIEGRSLAEAAASIRVKHETVRSQVKSIFLKTGTRRQSELIRLLALVPGR